MTKFRKVVTPLIPTPWRNRLSYYRDLHEALQPIAQRCCPICEYEGWFEAFGRPPRLDARCPGCRSLERHRLFHLALTRDGLDAAIDASAPVLHFAAEAPLEPLLRERFARYQTADLFRPADLTLNIEQIDLPDASYGLVIANHVLEHVDDQKAAAEIGRILRPGGIFIAMTPVIEGWDQTYENAEVDGDEARVLHFGQGDHVRYYGRDFRQRIERGGLTLMREITAEGEDVIRYGLLRGEKVFVYQKTG